MMYLLLIVGFVLLVKGADIFVDGSSSVAKNLRVPSIIIGLTVVAFGTSCPEAAVSITASLKGQNAISFSNVVGSNIFNLMVVTGLSAMLSPVKTDKDLLKRDFPISILAAAALVILALDTVLFGGEINMLGRIDGIILLAFFAVFLWMMIRAALSNRSNGAEEDEYKIMPMGKSCIFIVIGLAGIIIGGQLVVNAATDIAYAFGMSETLVGLTIVSIGTSLPELVTSVVAAKKGEADIALGNVVGSNIFNILLILGLASTIAPMPVDMASIYDTVILIIVSILVFVPVAKIKKVNRLMGIVMVVVYAVYMAYIIAREFGML